MAQATFVVRRLPLNFSRVGARPINSRERRDELGLTLGKHLCAFSMQHVCAEGGLPVLDSCLDCVYQIARLDDSCRAVGRKAVGPDGIGKLLSERGTAHQDLDRFA